MPDRLYLHVPAFDELWYRQKMLRDAETMGYNKGFDLSIPSYHKQTGCIDFPEDEWQSWFDCFVGQEPDRYYAYITCLEDKAFIGEVNVHKVKNAGYYDMGIVLEAKYRGQGYALEALRLLLEYAFAKMDVPCVHNDFEDSRSAAVRTHLSAGFRVHKRQSGMLELLISKEDYIKSEAAEQ